MTGPIYPPARAGAHPAAAGDNYYEAGPTTQSVAAVRFGTGQ